MLDNKNVGNFKCSFLAKTIFQVKIKDVYLFWQIRKLLSVLFYAHLEQNSQGFQSRPLVLDGDQCSNGIEHSPLFNKEMNRHSQRFAKKKYLFQKPSESKRTFLMFLGRLCVSTTLLAQQPKEPKIFNRA